MIQFGKNVPPTGDFAFWAYREKEMPFSVDGQINPASRRNRDGSTGFPWNVALTIRISRFFIRVNAT